MLLAIVFDFDGVLADTEPLHLRAFAEVLASSGVPLERGRYYKRYVGLSDPNALAAVLADAGVEMSAERQAALVAAKGERYRSLLHDAAPVFPGVADALREWSRLVPLAIASGAFRVEIDRVLDGARLGECFSAIVAAEDAARGKPDPEPFARALSALAVTDPGRTVAIEDSVHGLLSARAAGMRTIAVTTTHAAADLDGAADLVVPGVAGLTLATIEGVLDGQGRSA